MKSILGFIEGLRSNLSMCQKSQSKVCDFGLLGSGGSGGGGGRIMVGGQWVVPMVGGAPGGRI